MKKTFANLRIAGTDSLAGYLHDSYLLTVLGNRDFAKYVAESRAGLGAATREPVTAFDLPWVVFHSWLDGFVEVDEQQVTAIAELVSTGRATTSIQYRMAAALDGLDWLDDVPVDISAIARRTRTTFLAMQNLTELRGLLRRVDRIKPRVIVEIGTARGGLLYALAQVADPHARLISIDLPAALNGGGQVGFEREVFASFAVPTQRIICIAGDSHAAAVADALDELLAGSEIDLLVIDGDHGYRGVRADLLRYGPRVAPVGMVALHDICLLPEAWGPSTGVGLLWQQLQSHFDGMLESIVDRQGTSLPHRPPGTEWSWGFGLLRGDQARAWSAAAASGARECDERLEVPERAQWSVQSEPAPPA